MKNRILIAFTISFLGFQLTVAQSPPISTNWYRIPYQDGSEVTITRDFIDHGSTPAGNIGPMDMNASQANRGIVAAASGIVRFIRESRTECGCNSAYGSCANSIRIEHANGEWTYYLHIQANSATAAGISVGQCVTRGQRIATEGDIGWTCGSGRNANIGSCVSSVPSGAGRCGRHLHFEVRRGQGGPFVNPRICTPDVAGHNRIFRDNATYTADFCSSSCNENYNFSGSFANTMRVIPVDNQITTSGNATVQNSASIGFQAGNRIRLSPGFKARTGAYFRASIQSCTGTLSGCPRTKTTASLQEPKELPSDIVFDNNIIIFPNPFKDNLTFQYTLDNEDLVKLSLFDISGKQIAMPIDNPRQPKGTHKTTFTSKNLKKGLYLYVLKIGINKKSGFLLKQ